MKALLVLKDWQPKRLDKATYLANHKKTRLWPWTQLSSSPRIVLFRWNVVDHVDHVAPRAPRRWMTAMPRKGTTRSRGRRGSGCPRGEEYEGSLVRLRCEAAVAAVDHVDHVAPRAPRRWMTAMPRKGTTRSRGRRGSGCPRGEEYEGSLVRLRCEAAVAAGPG